MTSQSWIVKKTSYALVFNQTVRYISAMESDVITPWDMEPLSRRELPLCPFPAVEVDDLYFNFLLLSYKSNTTELKKAGEIIDATIVLIALKKVSPQSLLTCD